MSIFLDQPGKYALRLLARAIEHHKAHHFLQLSRSDANGASAATLSSPIRSKSRSRVSRFRISSTVSIVYDGGGRRSSQSSLRNPSSLSIAARNIANRTSPLATRRGLLERRHRGGNKNDFLQIERLARFAGKDQMPVMNRIECAAVNGDLFSIAPTLKRSTLNVQLKAFCQCVKCVGR